MTCSSPCMSCKEAPCCSHLEIFTFPVRSAKDLDQAIYFANFGEIETTLNPNWHCHVYFRSQCQHLSEESGCRIHDTPEQPLVCVNYSPYGCYFKPNMADKQQPKTDVIWMNTERWQQLAPALEFDTNGQILPPNWVNLAQFIGQINYSPAQLTPAPAEVADAPYVNWLIASESQTYQPDLKTFSLNEYRNICDNCSSWCCTHLSVPFKTPTQFKDIDYLRYCLNFPGTQVVVSDRGWSLLVKTACTHLKDNRCTIYDQPERPQICRYYPEQDCYYRKTTAKVRPDNYIRLAKNEFDLVSELFRFNQEGALLQAPDANLIRASVEEKLAAAALSR